MRIEGTTILGLRYKGTVAMAGDGQITFGDTIMKAKAVKIRRLYNDRILAGFAGAAADALALFERFETKIEEFSGNLPRAAVELAKDWRTDKYLQKLEALLAVADTKHSLLIAGTGEVVEPDDGILAIGSGGAYALAAARAIIATKSQMTAEEIARKALEIASEICVYTNDHITVESIK
ncbi:MAG: ATP-dependent protease subunit HslV [candidate division Zixibacteria bacterium]|jgi:ATP-dependent HslUV protease subunit HslV|nr:ATP-dependent protease subunit HslV [candidate division Zixibacteria bacterium]